MDTSSKFCHTCGKFISTNELVCKQCGAVSPGVHYFPSESSRTTTAKKPRRGARFWLGLTALVGGVLTSCLSLSAILVYVLWGSLGIGGLTAGLNATVVPTIPPVTAAVQTPTLASVVMATPTSRPTAEDVVAATPTETLATLAIVNDSPGIYTENFEDVESGWERLYEEEFNLDYAPGGIYRIEMKMPNRMVASEPPYPFEGPLTSMHISVRARGEGGNGYFGVMCHFKDDYNYYRAGVSISGEYMISKLVNGSLSYLTDPPWKPILLYAPDEQGFVSMTLVCEDGLIQLMIDEIGQEILTDTSLDQGVAAIFVSAGDQPDDEGVYMRAYFDDFTLELH